MKLPPLNALRAFDAAARCGTLAAAARELGVSPAAVSMQVRKLEDYFGKTLFSRSHNSIELTDAGLALFRESAEGLGRIAVATQRMLGQAASGSVCISVLPVLAERWLPAALQGLRAAMPQLGLRVRVEDDPLDLQREGIDLRVTYGEHFYPGCTFTALFREQVVPVCAPGLLSLDSGNLMLESLPSEHFIHVEWGVGYQEHLGWNEWFAEAGIARSLDVGRGIRASNTSLGLSLAVRGLGVALVQRRFAQAGLNAGLLCQLSDVNLLLPRDYGVINRGPCLQNSVISQIVRHLQRAEASKPSMIE